MKPADQGLFYSLAIDDIGALTVYLEARNQGMDGMLAVAFVIMNRANLWNKPIVNVCYDANQFSCYLSNNKQYTLAVETAKTWPIDTDKALQEAMAAFTCALNKTIESPVGKATFYKVEGTKNDWFDKQIAIGKFIKKCQIGKHIFYEEKRFLK